ncbi:MAG: fibronectin type III domain-containing protein [Candidatus Thiodiazotropha sp.]
MSAATQYSYYVVAYDAAGNVSEASDEITLSTANTGEADTTPPAVPVGLSASNVTATTITLGWSASNDDTATTGYRIFRDGVEVGNSSATNYHDSGLSPDTQYQYQVSAYDAAGNESALSDVIVQSTMVSDNSDTTPPEVPTGLNADSVTSNTIALSWSESSDDTATTGYRVYRGGTEIATSSVASFTDSGLSPNTQYQYQVSAYDEAGNESDPSEVLSQMTTAAVSGDCGAQTGSVVAIPFSFVMPTNVGKYLTLAATSTLVEYNRHSYLDAPNIDWSMRYKDYKYGNGGGAVSEWRLDSVPTNGTLYEGTTALSSNDTIFDPDDLYYEPNSDFTGEDSFTYCASDTTGTSNVARVSLHVADPANYPMPIGIPDPGFGINESAPADPPAWPAAESAGYYYIDSDNPACSDDSSYGYPDVPRCSFPATGSTIEAGGKVVLAPSSQPYTLRDSSWHQLNFNGQPGATSWLIGDEKGADKPRIVAHPNHVSEGAQLRISGGHMRISGVIFDGIIPRHMGGGADNVVLRHAEVKNNPSTGRGGTSVGLSTEGSNLLAFNVYAHDNGIVEADGLSEERDIHAFVGTNQAGYWMLDNRCDENAGDCVQLTNNNTSSDVYIGRLVAHSEGENCIDIKDFNRVVVSESSCWDLRPVTYGNSGGNAQNFYVNDEGVQQNYVYFLNNRSWDTGGVNYAASNIGGSVYFIGNISFASPAGSGLDFGGGNGSRYVYFNTFSESEIGMYLYGSGASLDRYVAANIIDGATLYQTRLRSATSVINTLDYNFYTDSSGDFASGGSTPTIHNGLSAFQSATGFSQNSVEGVDASFINQGVYDFRLNPGSALIDSVPEGFISSQPILTDLTNDLGISLMDIAGTSRPQGTAYDAGAYSYTP